MRFSILILSLFIVCNLTAQTKKIAFKSHSGNDENFKVALKQNLFDMEESNFGLPATKSIYTKSLDSVIKITPAATILVVSNYSTETFPKKGKPMLTSIRRDTLYEDPLFSKQHSLDSIRNVLKIRKTYQNPVSKIIFIGFDNKKVKNNKQSIVTPALIDKGPQNDSNISIVSSSQSSARDTSIYWMLGLIIGLSLLAGFLAWKFASPNQPSAFLQNS